MYHGTTMAKTGEIIMISSPISIYQVTMVDEVMWLLNVRGCDVPYNPVALCYAVLYMDKCVLYIDSGKIVDEVAKHLDAAGITVKAYGALQKDLELAAAGGLRVWIDPDQASISAYWALLEGESSLEKKAKASKRRRRASPDNANGSAENGSGEGHCCMRQQSPIAHLKSVKNEVEVEGMKEAHLRDAVALAQFWNWIEKKIASGETSSEVEVDEMLLHFRGQQQGFIEHSFPTIAGADAHGAVIHYRATESSSKTIDKSTMLLVDSGAQYDCGTTDVTRTVHFGTPKASQRDAYTRVLKGHIALDSARFPEGTPGCTLDILARQFLWKNGLDYMHGTGHGVGAGLNVHEGPQSISPRFGNMTPLRAGMIVSNEPGYYEDNGFGVRIENLILIEKQDTENMFRGKAYLGFSSLTLVPIDVRLIDASLLNDHEVNWIDSYHRDVWEKVSPRVDGDVSAWLHERTRPLAEQQRLLVEATAA